MSLSSIRDWLRRRLLEMAGKNAHISTKRVNAVDPGPAEVALTVPDTYQQIVRDLPEGLERSRPEIVSLPQSKDSEADCGFSV